MNFIEYLIEKQTKFTVLTDLPKGEVLHGKTGIITSIDFGTEVAQIDFGNGDKYGIAFSRIRSSSKGNVIFR